MQFCQGCGARRAEGSRFCVQCGRSFPAEASTATRKHGLVRKLTLVGPSALIFFFLPWITVSCQMTGFSVALSGWELANGVTLADQKIPGQPILFLAPLAAVALLGVLLLAKGRPDFAPKPLAVVQTALAGAPLLLMLVKYVSWVEDARRNTGGLVTISPHVGFVLAALAFLAGAMAGLAGVTGRETWAAATPVRGVSAVTPQGGAASFCPRCGTRSGGAARFCVECGHALG